MILDQLAQDATFKDKTMLTDTDLDKELAAQLAQETALQTKVRTMFHLQYKLNTLIKPDWFHKGECDYNRATAVELAELMDHYGYKWWKHQTPNVDQCKLEVIDIAHFHISHLEKLALLDQHKYDFYADEFIENVLNPEEVEKTPEEIRDLIDECMFLASSKNFSSKAFGMLMHAFDLTAEELSETYILKNTLNLFRLNNGYKDGTYVKVWDGKEDNEVLLEIAERLDKDSATFADDLYTNLYMKYRLATDSQAA